MCSSVMVRLSSICEALGLIPKIGKKEGKKNFSEIILHTYQNSFIFKKKKKSDTTKCVEDVEKLDH